MAMEQEPTKEGNFPWVMFLGLVLILLVVDFLPIYRLSEQHRVEEAAKREREEKVRRGAALFVANCARCHGAEGYGTNRAPMLHSKYYLGQVSDSFLKHTISDGRPRTIMPAWGQDSGGPLNPQEIDQLVAFIRNWETPLVEVGRTVTASGLPAASVEGGQETFEWFCSECHGRDGKTPTGSEDRVANSPETLAKLDDPTIRQRILDGGKEMPGFRALLSQAEVEGLLAFINTWPRETLESGP